MFTLELPRDFMNKIKKILRDNPTVPTSTPFLFENTKNAAIHNSKILESFNFDITKTIAAFPHSHISYGSEFRNPTALEPLLNKHPFWPSVKQSLSKGAKFPLSRLNNKRRLEDLKCAIKRGNHKSAKPHHTILNKMVSTEVQHGFQKRASHKKAKQEP